MLETCGVGRVTCDGYVDAFLVHDGNAFAYIVGAVAVNLGTKSVRVSDSLHFLQFACIVIIIGLYVCESVDSGNNLRSILSKSVQDHAEWFLTYLVRLLCDTNRTFCSRE